MLRQLRKTAGSPESGLPAVLRSPAARKRRNKTTSALLFKNVEQKPAFSY